MAKKIRYTIVAEREPTKEELVEFEIETVEAMADIDKMSLKHDDIDHKDILGICEIKSTKIEVIDEE